MSQRSAPSPTVFDSVPPLHSKRAVAAVAIFIVSVLFAPVAYWFATAAMGMGRGTPIPMVVLYPLPIGIAFLTGQGPGGLIKWMMFAQYPGYGLFVASATIFGLRWFGISLGAVALLHLGGLAVLAYAIH